MPELSNPHDRFFKAASGRPALAADFLRAHWPAAVAAVVDLDPAALTLLPESYVDPALSRARTVFGGIGPDPRKDWPTLS